MMPVDKVKKDIMKRYDRNPSDWHVLVGRDHKGYFDVIVIHDADAWLIKEQPINPLQSVGFGVKDSLLDQKVARRITSHTYGLRPLSEHDVKKVAKAVETGHSLSQIINRVLSTDPVASNELQSPMALQGPIIHSPRSIEQISENQAELDRKLRIELERLLFRRYSQTIAPYL